MSQEETTLMTFRKGFITAAGAGTLMLGLNAWAIWTDTQTDRRSAKEFISAQQSTNQIQADRNKIQDERNQKIDGWIAQQAAHNIQVDKYIKAHK